jgi:hypothetical protein
MPVSTFIIQDSFLPLRLSHTPPSSPNRGKPNPILTQHLIYPLGYQPLHTNPLTRFSLPPINPSWPRVILIPGKLVEQALIELREGGAIQALRHRRHVLIDQGHHGGDVAD